MRTPSLLALLALLPAAFPQDVGSGAPNAAMTYAFLTSYYRSNFSNLVSLPPINNVVKLGTTGYLQEFYDANRTTGVKYALILPNATGTAGDGAYTVFQSYPSVYAYYAQIGVITAGYPTSDTQNCPALVDNSCVVQFFSKPYVLFAYASAVNGGALDFFTRDPFYTKWQSLGGIYIMGPATSAESAFTSAAGNIATIQTYYQGMIANITGGNIPARTIGVKGQIYVLYQSKGTYIGSMGLPLGDELKQANGHFRQAFEGGTVDYDPANPASAMLLVPVKSITVAPAPVGGTLKLNEGDTATLTATANGTDGSILAGRQFTWNTTNGRIVFLQATQNTASIKAIGGGAASVTVSAEGVTSTALSVFVNAPCCGVGEGAPTPALQQSFQDAINRNKLNPKLPAASPVGRAGAGYLQALQAADTGDIFWLAAAQSTGNAYLIKGALLTEYENQGGPTGRLGYPLSDPTAGGRQLFELGALAGSPVQAVTGPILAKWALLGYENGVAGSPTALAMAFLTSRATAGFAQTFSKATLFSITSGTQSGKVYSISGPIVAAYSGPGSDLGVPISDEIGINGVRHQDFEGGYMEYAQGDALARVVAAPRSPAVTATPNSVPAGSLVRLSLGGFDNGAQIRVSVTGQQDFLTTVPTGAYIWENYIPATAASSIISIKAVDVKSQASSQTSYAIRSNNDARVSIKAIAGDAQTGLPGATLPVRVQVLYADDAGNPIPNATVRFTPSPGGELGADTSAVTDANGIASTNWRLPNQEGVALLAVVAGGHVINVTARASHAGLSNFPNVLQTNGALLAAASAALRYFQNRGEMPAPLGLAEPAALNVFLKGVCGGDVCDGFVQDQVPNLWRLRGFVGNALDIKTIAPDDRLVRDALAQGWPTILALNSTQNGAPAGSHFVVATGVDASGNLAIMDPKYAQASLYSYLYGFSSGGATVAGTLTGAAVVTPQAPSDSGFMIVSGGAPTTLQSPQGTCGADFAGLRYCEGTAGFYQLDLAGAGAGGQFIDLGPSGIHAELSGATSFAVDRSTGAWMVAPLTIQFQASGVVNSASGTPDLAPGSLASIIGSGFVSQPTLAVNGVNAAILKATPFQLDFQIPASAAAGPAVIDVVNEAGGAAQQTINLQTAAPAIQTLGGISRRGRINNQDGSSNGVYRPATRGQSVNVFGTGFGPLATAVRAFAGGVEVPVTAVTPVVNTPGLFQVRLTIPANLAPGLRLELLLRQGDAASNTVDIAIQ